MLSVLSPPVVAQVPDEVRVRLGRDGVATTDQWFFASATGTIRGTRDAEEDRQAARAMQAIARAMCRFEPAPGKRLEAGITGFAMASSIQRGREVEVIMRAPVQNPVCRIQVAEATPATAAPKADARLQPPESLDEKDQSTRVLQPAYIREKNMTIRVYGGEY